MSKYPQIVSRGRAGVYRQPGGGGTPRFSTEIGGASRTVAGAGREQLKHDGTNLMKPNRLQQALAEGRIPVGHMILEFGTRGIAQILETAGLDFAIIDMEHTAFSMNEISNL